MKETISSVFIGMLLLSGLLLGIYFGDHVVTRGDVIKWSWYQPSEGPDMGRWKEGSSGDFLALLIIGSFMVLGSALGLGFGLLLKYLAKRFVYPRIMNMGIFSKVLVTAFLLAGSCYGFYLGRTIVEPLMITHWTAYYMGDWDSWRYQSSWGFVPLSATMITTASGLVVGLLIGLCAGLLAKNTSASKKISMNKIVF